VQRSKTAARLASSTFSSVPPPLSLSPTAPGLPIQVRDHFLGAGAVDVPTSEVGREYFNQQLEHQVASGATAASLQSQSNDALLRLARTEPYYKRNLPRVCSFYAKGECTRGEGCPYRHDMPTPKEDPLAHQDLVDRYHGRNDPVAEKMMARAEKLQK
jgi:pre-mRNA-splicing factor RBM22/SLT11